MIKSISWKKKNSFSCKNKEDEFEHEKIEAYLKKEKEKFECFLKEKKVLILGSSDSGKSTLLKQIRIHYGEDFTDIERAKSKSLIFSTILTSICLLINNQQSILGKYSRLNEFVLEGDEFPPELRLLLLDISKDPVFKSLLDDPEYVSDNSILY